MIAKTMKLGVTHCYLLQADLSGAWEAVPG